MAKKQRAIAATVEFWPLDRLKAYERNARTHPPQQIAEIAASIEKFGFAGAILADAKGIVAGHGRKLGLESLFAAGKTVRMIGGLEIPAGHAPVIDCAGWSDADRRAYILADNRIAQNAGWDLNLLAIEVGDLKVAGVDVSMLGFGESELRAMARKRVIGGTDPDDAPPLPKTPISKPGDLWILGEHRLLCGDSTSKSDVARLLNGARPHLGVTDPPYGVNYDASWREKAGASKKGTVAAGKVLNDDRADWREAWALFPGAVIYVWHGALHASTVQQSLEAVGFQVRAQIVWVKTRPVFSRGHYHWQHEPCQPAGTMVTRVVKEGRWRDHSVLEQVPIEEIRKGDKVVSFGNAKVYRRGREVLDITSRSYVGNMHRLKVGQLSTRATSEHQFTVRFDPAKADHAIVYLMRRGDRWRVGVCKLFNSRWFGLAVRLSQELGDEAWILSGHPSLNAARVEEQIVGCVYGIPQTHWETGRSPDWRRTPDDIEHIYRSIGVDRLAEGAKRALKDRGLLERFPFITAQEAGRFSRKQSRIVRACNLVPTIMQVPVPTVGEEFDWRGVSSVEFEGVDDAVVWSMQVDQDQHYVADGIVTHNCLYAAKDAPGGGTPDHWQERFAPMHELAEYAVREGGKGHWEGGRQQSTVWTIEHAKSDTGHSTQKPIEAMRRPIINNSAPGDGVYEPFSGSGTTLIACEMEARRCFAMELSPAYVDVAVTRWEQFTGQKAKRERKVAAA